MPQASSVPTNCAETPYIEALAAPMRRITDTRYLDFELRSSRDTFTRKLERICRAADEHPEVEFDYRGLFERTGRARARIKRLWVAGSYARGAGLCGDLDLIVEHEVQPLDGKGLPWERDTCRALLGKLPDVRFYAGNPSRNSSRVAMPEAVLLWTGAGCDWRGAIGNIRIDPAAGPAPRKTSVLPFRMEQLRGDENDHLEDLVDARAKGLVEWEFIPFDEQLLAPIPDGVLSSELKEAARAMSHDGAARRRLAPAILRLLHARYARTRAVLHQSETGLLEYGNSVVRYGSLWVRTSCLSKHLAQSEIVLIPELSKRGPNGAWVVRRGPLHPLTPLLAQARLWALPHEGGIDRSTLFEQYGRGSRNGRELIELFSDRAGLESHLANVYDSNDLPGTLQLFDGHAVVAALGCCDAVDLDSDEFNFWELVLNDPSGEGWTFLTQGLRGAEQAPVTQQLLQRLRKLNDQTFSVGTETLVRNVSKGA